jgi:hypothetical protein
MSLDRNAIRAALALPFTPVITEQTVASWPAPGQGLSAGRSGPKLPLATPPIIY